MDINTLFYLLLFIGIVQAAVTPRKLIPVNSLSNPKQENYQNPHTLRAEYSFDVPDNAGRSAGRQILNLSIYLLLLAFPFLSLPTLTFQSLKLRLV